MPCKTPPPRQTVLSGRNMSLWPLLQQGIKGTWNIYNADGETAVPFDTFFSISVSNETKVTTHPMERNGFFAYNKVQSPGQLEVVLGLTGDTISRSGVITALDALAASTDLVSVVTPEKTFVDYSLESFDYSRESGNGIDRLVVKLSLLEIVQVSPEYTNETIPAPKQAADGKTRNAGRQTAEQADAATEERVSWLRNANNGEKIELF